MALKIKWLCGGLPEKGLAPDIDLHKIAAQHELSGGAILNVIRYAALCALENGGAISAVDVQEGISRELGKEGRSA